MSNYSLGLNFGHDTSACLIKDGKIYAAEEERWSGIKHNYPNENEKFLFPHESLKYCLERAKISLDKIDTIIGVSLHPEHRLGEDDGVLLDYLPKSIKRKIKFISHHQAHVLSGFYLTKFRSAVGLCIDGAGSMLGPDFDQRERVSGFYLDDKRVDKIYHLSETDIGKSNKSEQKENKQSLGNFYKNFAIRTVVPGDEPEGTMMAMAALSSGKKFYRAVKK
ncbi:MAG: hypothetical protein WCI57_00835 [Candidatus Berkelbacteria bacterium]